jgi:hypothetical protein
MNYNNLVERIISEEATGGMVAPVTAHDGNISIDYLPGGFISAKEWFKKLSQLKKVWKLEVLENGGQYNLKLENYNIAIPKQSYKEFNEKVYNIIGKNEIDLTQIINEALREDVDTVYLKLEQLIKGKLLTERAIAQTIIIRNAWLQKFPIHINLKLDTSTLIDLNHYNESIAGLLGNIKEIYKDDLGKLEMLTSTMEKGGSLSNFKPFSDYINLVGAKIQSDCRDVKLVLEIEVDLSKTPAQSIEIDSEVVVDDIDAHNAVKVVGNKLYPKGTMFTPFLFTLIKDTIKDLEK